MRLLVLLAATALLLTGCAASPRDPRPSVVASTDVYADIARSVGGDRITVSAIIDTPSKDPHQYEASARDLLTVSRASLLIENGGGYDGFMGRLIAERGSRSTPVIEAVSLVSHDGDNEHVWYDLHTATALASRIARELTSLDPLGAAAYDARVLAFTARVDALAVRIAALRAAASGRPVLATEAVPLYLLGAIGLADRTPAAFATAIEAGTDIPPGVLLGVLRLVEGHGVALVAYNSQTATGQTERVRQAAEAAAVPVVDFAETLPRGIGYVAWMQRNVDAVAAALALTENGAHRP